MGVFPEPARRADDVSRLVPGASAGTGQTGDPAAPPWTRRGASPTARRGLRRLRLLAAVIAGLLGGQIHPEIDLVPAARAHGRIDLGPRAARALAEAPPSVDPSAWDGLPVAEQQPATTALIAADLAALPRVMPETDAVRFGARSVPRRVVETIVRAADAAGVDPAYLMALADKESSFDVDAKAATSSAQGLFQFVAATWLEMIRDFGARHGLAEEAAAIRGRGAAITVADGLRARVLGLRNDARVAALMAAELVRRDRGRIEARVGRPLSATELYLAHFLGTADAGRFLSLTGERPDAVAGQAFGSAARANRGLFTQTEGGRRRDLTVAELHGRIEGMIDRRLNRYQGVAAVASVPEDAPAPRPAEASEAPPPGGV